VTWDRNPVEKHKKKMKQLRWRQDTFTPMEHCTALTGRESQQQQS
jgi:hypothetical protein